MEIVHEQRDLERYMREAVKVSHDSPVLLDRFLNDSIECDVDCIRDVAGKTLIGGVMEHIEQAGVHSGDSACAIPPQTLPKWVVEVIEAYTAAIATALDVRGPINVQYAVVGTSVYVIEANPRASRTVPFVAKATGVPLAKVAWIASLSRLMRMRSVAEGACPSNNRLNSSPSSPGVSLLLKRASR
jgi:carbamoyl-phosphate synthase large subunit